MKSTDFTLTISTGQSPHKVFETVKNMRAWWVGYHAEEITGDTEKLHDEFSYIAAGGVHHTRHKVVELIPDRKIVWLTTYSNLTFTEKKDEWTGTKIIFKITETGFGTELRFTHEGLTPAIECYTACAPTWTQYLENKLLPLITTGDYE